MVDSFELGSIDKALLIISEGYLHTSFGTQVYDPTWKPCAVFPLKAIYFLDSPALKTPLTPHISQLPFLSKCIAFSLVYSCRKRQLGLGNTKNHCNLYNELSQSTSKWYENLFSISYHSWTLLTELIYSRV